MWVGGESVVGPPRSDEGEREGGMDLGAEEKDSALVRNHQ